MKTRGGGVVRVCLPQNTCFPRAGSEGRNSWDFFEHFIAWIISLNMSRLFFNAPWIILQLQMTFFIWRLDCGIFTNRHCSVKINNTDGITRKGNTSIPYRTHFLTRVRILNERRNTIKQRFCLLLTHLYVKLQIYTHYTVFKRGPW